MPALDKFSVNTDIAPSRPGSTRQFTYAAAEQLLLHAVLRDTAYGSSSSQCLTDSVAVNMIPEAADAPKQQMQMPASSLGVHSKQQALGSWSQCSASTLATVVLDVLTCGVDSQDQPFTGDNVALWDTLTSGVKHCSQTPNLLDTVESVAPHASNLHIGQRDYLVEPVHLKPDYLAASTALLPYISTAQLLQHSIVMGKDHEFSRVCFANSTFLRQTSHAEAMQYTATPSVTPIQSGKGEQVYWC